MYDPAAGRRHAFPVRLAFLALTVALLAALLPQLSHVAAAKQRGRLTITASIYPIYIHLLNVTAGVPGVTVNNMTGPMTGCLHDYQLTPADMKRLETSDVFVVNGAGMETFVGKVVKARPRMTVIDASLGIKLLRDGGEPNPHVWVSVSNAIRQVKNIGRQLAKVDEVNAQRYTANAGRYAAKLAALRAKMRNALRKAKRKDIVTFHEAFPYFAREFGLRVITVVEREPGSEPNARELADTVDIVAKSGCKTLFVEPQYSAKAAQAIAKQTGARVYTLDPAVTGPMKPDAYIRTMEANLKTLVKALCS